MGRIPRDIIERINDTADILEVVAQYVDLKKRGRNYFGLCPFHHEKTASFSVAPEKNIYHCFGCGAGGSTINFLMEYEKISFVEAVQKLGARYGIEVELEQDGSSREFFSQLFELHRLAADLYSRTLFSKPGKAALDYLYERGLSEKVLKEFQVGFAPENWEYLLGEAQPKNYSSEVLDKSGLFTRSDKGRFDRFHSRIMFPISDSAGKVIAFGGRIFDSTDPAKYLNSPETPLYHKSDVLFGLHKTRAAIRSAEVVLLVEGYMDFLTLYQAGITNLVAVSGTALTERHAAQIRKIAARVLLAYDGDEAGIGATLRSGYTLLRNAIEPRVVVVPPGLDPDDWVRNEGADVFKAAMDKAVGLVDFHLDVKNALSLSGVERSRFVSDLLKEVGSIEDGILRNEILRTIGQRMQIDEHDLLRVLQKQLRYRRRGPEREIANGQEPLEFTSKLERAQVEIIRALAGRQPEALEFAQAHLDLNIFTEPLLKQLAQSLLESKDEISLGAVIDQFTAKQEREAVTKILFSELVNADVDSEILLRECLITIRRYPISEKIKQLRIKIRDLEAAGKDTTELILEVAQLQQELKELSIAYTSE